MDKRITQGEFKGQPVCGVVAVAIVTNRKYDTVWQTLKPFYGSSWKGGTSIYTLRKVIQEKFGWHARFDTPYRRMSLAKWVDRFAEPDRRYIVRIGNHFVAVIDGKISDQHQQNATADTYFRRRGMVSHVLEVWR